MYTLHVLEFIYNKKINTIISAPLFTIGAPFRSRSGHLNYYLFVISCYLTLTTKWPRHQVFTVNYSLLILLLMYFEIRISDFIKCQHQLNILQLLCPLGLGSWDLRLETWALGLETWALGLRLEVCSKCKTHPHGHCLNIK